MGMATALQVSQNQGLGMVVACCCPGGTSSNIFTYFSGSDVTLSLVATGLSNLAAMIALPILIPFWSSFFTPADARINYVEIAQSVALVIIPCSLGIIVKAFSDV